MLTTRLTRGSIGVFSSSFLSFENWQVFLSSTNPGTQRSQPGDTQWPDGENFVALLLREPTHCADSVVTNAGGALLSLFVAIPTKIG